MKDLHILIVGHACFPNMGSEAGVTWNWAWHLAERNRVWVIAHGFARPLVEQYMRDHPRPNLRFIWVGPLGWWDPWRNPGPTKARGLRLHYLFWRHAALAAAQRLMAREAIDIVHHVSWNSISAPPLAVAYRQTLRLGADRWWTRSALALPDLHRPLCFAGAASQPACSRHAVDARPAPYRGADRSAAGGKW